MIPRSRAVAVLAVASLAACSPPSKPPGMEVADGAPLRSIRPADVADAVPRPDPILAVGNKSPYRVNGVTYEIMDDPHGYVEEGVAS